MMICQATITSAEYTKDLEQKIDDLLRHLCNYDRTMKELQAARDEIDVLAKKIRRCDVKLSNCGYWAEQISADAHSPIGRSRDRIIFEAETSN